MANISDVIEKLLEKTEQNRINWKPTAAANTFAATIGSLGVSISVPRQTLADSLVRLQVFNESGRIVQECIADSIDQPHDHGKLMKIHSKASQIASGNDPRLDELLSELNKV